MTSALLTGLLVSAWKNHFLPAAAWLLCKSVTTCLAFLTSTAPQSASIANINVIHSVCLSVCVCVWVQLQGSGIYFGEWIRGKESKCSWVNRRWPHTQEGHAATLFCSTHGPVTCLIPVCPWARRWLDLTDVDLSRFFSGSFLRRQMMSEQLLTTRAWRSPARPPGPTVPLNPNNNLSI